MIDNPTEEIIFMKIMTLICELTGLRSDSYYSIENKNKDNISLMTLNPNYKSIIQHIKNIFYSDDALYKDQELEKVTCILNEINNTLNLQLKKIKNAKNKNLNDTSSIEEVLHFTASYKV